MCGHDKERLVSLSLAATYYSSARHCGGVPFAFPISFFFPTLGVLVCCCRRVWVTTAGGGEATHNTARRKESREREDRKRGKEKFGPNTNSPSYLCGRTRAAVLCLGADESAGRGVAAGVVAVWQQL